MNSKLIIIFLGEAHQEIQNLSQNKKIKVSYFGITYILYK